ncbi:DUF6221 family protein [Streptomyces sp. NPDC008222]|uniref:DUF6221 family protein n=1 Tax=Streptomyces sp. NPDC008222 TaxID=3364820 RepID=UPI0036E39FB4
MTSDLVVFLRARLDEEAARQRDIWERWHHKDCEAVPDVLNPGRETGFCDCGVPERVLRDIEAKLRILDEHRGSDSYVYTDDGTPACSACGDSTIRHPCRTLHLLASVYDSHPDYREEWRRYA